MPDIVLNRISALQTIMKERDIDLSVFGPTANMFYMAGVKLPETERFNAVVVPATGKPSIIVPSLQRALLSEATARVFDVKVWGEDSDPLKLVANMATNPKRVAIDSRLWSSFTIGLMNTLPKVEMLDAAEMTSLLRVTKDANEIALLTEAAGRFDHIWEEFFTGTLIGETENSIRRRLNQLVVHHGFPDGFVWCDVGSGPNGASPLHHGSERVIKPGDPVVIDFAAVRNGYFMDTCRTPIAGEPDPKFVEIYNVTNAARDKAAAAIRPGVSAESIDEIGRKVIADAGYGEYFIHRIGHGMGIDAHETPYIVKGNAIKLAAGMVFSNEPGIYIPDKWGVRIESIMVVSDTAGYALDKVTRDIVSMS